MKKILLTSFLFLNVFSLVFARNLKICNPSNTGNLVIVHNGKETAIAPQDKRTIKIADHKVTLHAYDEYVEKGRQAYRGNVNYKIQIGAGTHDLAIECNDFISMQSKEKLITIEYDEEW